MGCGFRETSTGRDGPENQKAFAPRKSENKGIRRILDRTRGPGWPYPSLCGEVSPALLRRGHDEHFPAGILTWGFEPRSSLPAFWRSGFVELVA